MTIVIIIGIIIFLFVLLNFTSKKKDNYSKSEDFNPSDISDDIYISQYTKSIESNPSDVSTYLSRAKRRRELHDENGALEDYNRAIELNSSDAVSYRDRALCKDSIGDKSGAIKDLNKAIELEPNNALFIWNRGRFRFEAIRDQEKRYEELDDKNLFEFRKVLEDFDRLIELEPESESYYDSRGRLKLYSNDNLGALEDFNKSIELHYNYYVVGQRARAKLNLGDYEGALIDSTVLIDSCPKTTDNSAFMEYEALFIRALAKYKLNYYKDNESIKDDLTRAIDSKLLSSNELAEALRLKDIL